MINVRYPEPDFQIRKESDSNFVFDRIRKKWLLLTDEEWVRQNFLNYLLKVVECPQKMISLEKEIKLHDLKKRFDILVYDKDYQPWMMVECKAPSVELNEKVLQQILRYNISIPVQHLIITNGFQTIGWQKTGKNLQLISKLPRWSRI
ncbi:MAG TPA: type I restriction enzyme HsdR N-terminal domain-containing protein [Flavisolibacter sp.]|nr:type I restriction enzyme HsdR N-terminal domain-containing protein [Flavisolibacter sp.]